MDTLNRDMTSNLIFLWMIDFFIFIFQIALRRKKTAETGNLVPIPFAESSTTVREPPSSQNTPPMSAGSKRFLSTTTPKLRRSIGSLTTLPLHDLSKEFDDAQDNVHPLSKSMAGTPDTPTRNLIFQAKTVRTPSLSQLPLSEPSPPSSSTLRRLDSTGRATDDSDDLKALFATVGATGSRNGGAGGADAPDQTPGGTRRRTRRSSLRPLSGKQAAVPTFLLGNIDSAMQLSANDLARRKALAENFEKRAVKATALRTKLNQRSDHIDKEWARMRAEDEAAQVALEEKLQMMKLQLISDRSDAETRHRERAKTIRIARGKLIADLDRIIDHQTYQAMPDFDQLVREIPFPKRRPQQQQQHLQQQQPISP